MSMTMEDYRRYDGFANALRKYIKAYGKGRPYDDETIRKIMRHLKSTETRLSHIAELECDSEAYNALWKDGVNPEQERIEANIVKYVEKHIGCKCHTQRDPRGFTVRLHLKKKATGYYYNTWDGETSGPNW